MIASQERLIDEAISHAVDLTHYSNGLVRRMRALLSSVDADLVRQLAAVLERADPSSFTVRRLEELLQGVHALDAQIQDRASRMLARETADLAEYEYNYQNKLFGPEIRSPTFQQVLSATTVKPFQGKLMAEWFDALSARRQARLQSAVATGFTEGRTIDEIVRTVRGTKAQGYKDGILQVGRREAEAIVRTAVSHTAASVREEMYKDNADLFTTEEWVSTLDSSTTPICQVRDGLKYTAETHDPIGHKVPWGAGPGRIHWGCRSTSVPVMREGFFAALNLPPGERASVDGPVSADTKYGAWLTRQSAARQDEVLGPTRGRMLRSGAIKFDRFFNREGRFLTLEQLKSAL